MGPRADGKRRALEATSQAARTGSAAQGLVRELVAAYLEESAPDRRADLDNLFPALFRASEPRIARAGGSPASFDRSGPGNVLATAVSVAHALVIRALAAREGGGDAAVGLALDRTEREIADATGDPHLVGGLRSQLDIRLDRIGRLAAMDSPHAALPQVGYRHTVAVEPPTSRPAEAQVEEGLETGGTEIEEKQGAAEVTESTASGIPRPRDARQGAPEWADLVMLVETERRDGQPFLRYRIGSPYASLGFNFGSFRSPSFQQEPQAYFRRFYEQLEELGREAARGAARLHRLYGHARGLSRQLLPKGLLEYLGSKETMGFSLHVLSEEPWIPWELLALEGEGGSEPRFLGDHYAITRWRTEGLAIPTELPMASIGLVVPVESGLPAVRRELELVRSLAGPGTRVSEIKPHYHEVCDSLRVQPHDTWHFAGHGSAPGHTTAGWQLVLDRSEHLEPADLETISFRTGSLLFLNACAVGRAEFSLTGLAGFADLALHRGAGAVIGPLWAVHDESAYRFARAFYGAFRGGSPLGEAARQARASVGASRPFDPSRLAYAVFGHPSAVCGRRAGGGTDAGT